MKRSLKFISMALLCAAVAASAACGNSSQQTNTSAGAPFAFSKTQSSTEVSLSSDLPSQSESSNVSEITSSSPESSTQSSLTASSAKVPMVVGLGFADAESKLKEAGFEVDMKVAHSNAFYSGYVMEQSPAADSEQVKGSKVIVTVSLGSETQSAVESSVESSEPSQESKDSDKEERAILHEYADNMARTGDLKSLDPYKASWTVSDGFIGDLNNDGSLELVVQYWCGLESGEPYAMKNEKQGIALKIFKVVDGKVQEYSNNDDLNYYVRMAGADVSAGTEITDELFIDDDGSLGIVTTRVNFGSDTTLLYDISVIKDGVLTQKDGFAMTEIYQSGRYGMGATLPDPEYWFMVSENNTYDRLFCFRSIDSVFNYGNNFIGLDEIRAKFASLEKLNLIPAYSVTSGKLETQIRETFLTYLNSEFYLR